MANDTNGISDAYVARTVDVEANPPPPTVFIVVPKDGLKFGEQAVGTVSALQFLVVRNRGPAPITLSVMLRGEDRQQFSLTSDCGRLPVDGACSIRVSVSP